MAQDYRLGVGTSADHDSLAESVNSFAERHLGTQVLREAVEAKPTVPDFWKPLAAQGLLGLHVTEEFEGQGAGLTELAVALEPLSRTCAPGPLVPTVMLSAVLARCTDPDPSVLSGLANGSVTGAVGLATGLTAQRQGEQLVVEGRSGLILGAALADVLAVAVSVDGDTEWVLLDSSEVTLDFAESIDVTRSSNRITVASVSTTAVLRGIDDDTIRAICGVVLSAEAIGITSWCVQTAAEYATMREQFGRPIGQFQGVKHRCAAMGIALETARAAVWDAAQALDDAADDASFAAAIAVSVAPDAAVRAARDCIQVLGGIGFTWEHEAHLYYRRALTLRGLLGRERDAKADIARRALAGDTRSTEISFDEDAAGLRESIAEELAAIAAVDDPEEQLRLVGDNGWVMPHLAKPYGRDAGPLEQLVIAEELRRSGVSLPELALAAWLLPSIAQFGTQQQRDELVAPTLRGELMWCQLFSEPGAGSDLASLRTEAVRVEGGWRVNGQKIWTSLGFLADWGGLLARTDKSVPKHEGIGYFVVRMDSPGITVRPLREMSGGTLFSEIFFDDVFIPDTGLVGEPNQGWQVARGTLAHERVALGKGNAMYATVDDLLKFGRRHEDVDLVRLGELVAENQTLQLLNVRAVLQQLRGTDPTITASVAKYLNMKFGQQVADFCHAELDAAGIAEESGSDSAKWIDQTLASRAMTIYGGTTEIQLNVIGERMLGLPRDPQPQR